MLCYVVVVTLRATQVFLSHWMFHLIMGGKGGAYQIQFFFIKQQKKLIQMNIFPPFHLKMVCTLQRKFCINFSFFFFFTGDESEKKKNCLIFVSLCVCVDLSRCY